MAENNVNRPVNVAVPSVLTEERAEDEAEDEAVAEDEEMPGLEDSDDDDEPLGPRVENQPMIALPPNVVHAVVYCTSCHQDVTPTQFNFCPECSITDACVPVRINIANACREAQVINHQKVISPQLRDAITRSTTKKLLLRMKEEEGAEPGSGGLPPKPAFRYVALGGPNDLAFSRMQTSALAESGFGNCAFTTVPSARAYPPDDIVMALPVEVSEVTDEYPDNLRNLAPAAAPPSCGFCRRAVAHSCCVRCQRRGCKSCVIRGWCTACLGPPYPPRRWPVETAAANASSRMNVLGPQRADVSVAVLTVQIVGSTDVVASPRRVPVLTGPVLGPAFTASRVLAFCVFFFQLGTVNCPDTMVATGNSSPAWWFWFVATVAIICWTTLLFWRAPTRLATVTTDIGTQTDFAAVNLVGPTRIITTHSGDCYHLEGCPATRLAHRDPNAAVLRAGTRFLKRCRICMPDPRPEDFDERARGRRRARVPEPVRREPADELFNCPTAVTLNVLSWLGAHIEPNNSWTRGRHWEEGCSQSCGCCRAANWEDWQSGCEACQDLWYFRGVNREGRIRVQMYNGI